MYYKYCRNAPQLTRMDFLNGRSFTDYARGYVRLACTGACTPSPPLSYLHLVISLGKLYRSCTVECRAALNTLSSPSPHVQV